MYLLNDNSDRFRIAFVFVLLATLYVIFDAYMMYSSAEQLQEFMSNPGFDVKKLEQFETNLRLHIILYVSFFLLTACVFILWFRRAYFNVHEFSSTKPKLEEGWAAGAWFVPVLCYFYPVQIMEDIWDKSLEHLKKNEHLTSFRKPTTLIYLWWIPYAFSLLIANLAYVLDGHSESLKDFKIGFQMDFVASCSLFISGIFLLIIMRAYHKVETDILHLPIIKEEESSE